MIEVRQIERVARVEQTRKVANVVTQEHVVHVAETGRPGRDGTNGAGYVHAQVAPSALWMINHNLGFRPAVELVDAGGAEFDAEVIHPTVNQTLVYLDDATAGFARLN